MAGAFIDPIRIVGLKELQASLKRMDGESHKKLRLALNDAGNVVVRVAGPRIPFLTGAARRSLRAASTQNKLRVQAGGSKAPYFPWLDYGGRTGRNKSAVRRFEKHGRYVYPAYYQEQENIRRLVSKRLQELVRESGLEVTDAEA